MGTKADFRLWKVETTWVFDYYYRSNISYMFIAASLLGVQPEHPSSFAILPPPLPSAEFYAAAS